MVWEADFSLGSGFYGTRNRTVPSQRLATPVAPQNKCYDDSSAWGWTCLETISTRGKYILTSPRSAIGENVSTFDSEFTKRSFTKSDLLFPS